MIRLTWRDRLRSWLGVKLFRLIGIRSGPAMVQIRGQWLFIHFNGDIYLLTPNYLHGAPLTITTLSRS
jgi:hypothetical protein